MIIPYPFDDYKGSFFPTPYRVAWLFSDRNIVSDPAYRLRRWDMHKALSNYGIISEAFITDHNKRINYTRSPDFNKYIVDNFDLAMIFNVYPGDVELCRMMRAAGKHTIFDHSECIFDRLPGVKEIMAEVSAIACCSLFLGSITEKYLMDNGILSKPVFVIRDHAEISGTTQTKIHSGKREGLTAVVCGGIGPVEHIAPEMYKVCQEAGYELLTISKASADWPWETRNWTPYTWQEDILYADVGLCFNEPVAGAAKSNVKVTTMMALGMPTIANDILAYQEAIINEYDGLICVNRDDWITNLIRLKDPDLRRTLGLRAKITSNVKFSMDRIAMDYLAMVSQLIKNTDWIPYEIRMVRAGSNGGSVSGIGNDGVDSQIGSTGPYR